MIITAISVMFATDRLNRLRVCENQSVFVVVYYSAKSINSAKRRFVGSFYELIPLDSKVTTSAQSQ